MSQKSPKLIVELLKGNNGKLINPDAIYKIRVIILYMIMIILYNTVNIICKMYVILLYIIILISERAR